MNPAFAGSGETLVAGTLRGYRSWNVTVISNDGTASLAPCSCGCGMEFDYNTGRSVAVDYGKSYYAEWQRQRYGDRDRYLLTAVSAGPTWDARDLTASCARHECGSSVLSNWYGSNPAMFALSAGGKLNTTVPGCSCAGRHLAPNAECTCGIYGWYTPDFATREHTGAVFGVVEISGRVLLGTTGFRAERARIVAVTRHPNPQTNPFSGTFPGRGGPDRTSRLLETVEDRYPGVRVVGSYYDLVKRYPPDTGTLKNLGIETGWVDDWDMLPGPTSSINGRYSVGGVVNNGLKAAAARWLAAYDGEPVTPVAGESNDEKDTETPPDD